MWVLILENGLEYAHFCCGTSRPLWWVNKVASLFPGAYCGRKGMSGRTTLPRRDLQDNDRRHALVNSTQVPSGSTPPTGLSEKSISSSSASLPFELFLEEVKAQAFFCDFSSENLSWLAIEAFKKKINPKEIFALMKMDSFPRFLRLYFYEVFLQQYPESW
ncbi:hypothetical protein EGR_02156 [Echinococcus granulosus]|uniref:RGS domain-containing protein n=1 Tax=Echinococcus granulosus TaxID=6210 RepID=W6UX22_ECHGR|nr:hypothetical protein EGR_02156 [Echinococcus granulosus]EUB63062.1 hypothetical protein EGR_02156 [Echinococcus granulosus]